MRLVDRGEAGLICELRNSICICTRLHRRDRAQHNQSPPPPTQPRSIGIPGRAGVPAQQATELLRNAYFEGPYLLDFAESILLLL
jgi:hypothetical protein